MTEERDSGHDATETVEARVQLAQSLKRYQELINLLPVGVIMGDLDENIILANKAMTEMLLTTEEKLIQGAKFKIALPIAKE